MIRFGKIQDLQTRKADTSTGHNPTQQNSSPFISDRKDLKLTNTTGTDII